MIHILLYQITNNCPNNNNVIYQTIYQYYFILYNVAKIWPVNVGSVSYDFSYSYSSLLDSKYLLGLFFSSSRRKNDKLKDLFEQDGPIMKH